MEHVFRIFDFSSTGTYSGMHMSTNGVLYQLPDQKEREEVAAELCEIANRVVGGYTSVFVVSIEGDTKQWNVTATSYVQKHHDAFSLYTIVKFRLQKFFNWIFESS